MVQLWMTIFLLLIGALVNQQNVGISGVSAGPHVHSVNSDQSEFHGSTVNMGNKVHYITIQFCTS